MFQLLIALLIIFFGLACLGQIAFTLFYNSFENKPYGEKE